MNHTVLLHALDHIDSKWIDEAATPPAKLPQKRRLRPLLVAAALFLVCGLTTASLWLFAPPLASENVLQITHCRLGNRLVTYRLCEDINRWDRFWLEERKDELIAEHMGGQAKYYSVKNTPDLYNLIMEENGKLTYLEFESIVFLKKPQPLEDWVLYANGFLSETDMLLLDFDNPPTLEESLKLIWGVNGAAQMQKVKIEKTGKNSDFAKQVKIDTRTIKDEESLNMLYDLLKNAVYSPLPSFHPTSVSPTDEAYLNGTAALSLQTDRFFTVTLESGQSLQFHFYPRDRAIVFPKGGDCYFLTEEDCRALIDLAKIDLTPRNWGMPALPEDPVDSPENQTATLPQSPEN